jgi:hypothetical protein
MRRLRLLGAFSGSFVLLGTFGCTATVVEASSDGGPTTTTQALVVFERAEREGKTAQTNISAKFLRAPVAADTDTIESIIGSQLELPSAGECLVVRDDGAAADDPSAGPVELFDVGDVTIRTATSAIPLAARAFPDVGDRVSGVFYTAPDTEGDLPAPGKYFLEGTGSLAVDRFAIETDAPAIPADVTIGGRPLADGIELREGAVIDITWRAPSPASAAQKDDLTYVEIVAENGVAARCAFEDRGHASLPASLLRDLQQSVLRDGAAATLALHRVRQGSFHVNGIDVGEVRFDMSVVASVALRAASDSLSRSDRRF